MKDFDMLFDELKNNMKEQLEAETKAKVDELEKANIELKNINRKLLKAVNNVDTAQKNFDLMNSLINKLKADLQPLDSKEKEARVYSFLDCFFNKDFKEDTYEAPLWLGCVTQYYSNRKTVVDILKLLDFKVPYNIENFRLPLDWTEEELDVVFDNMEKHVNCNCCHFESNLRWWKPNALDDPITVCTRGGYTELPWQFLLRNPLLKKEKYLTKIGEMFFYSKFRPYEWLHFANITKYQTLTDEEIKLIINNIDFTLYDNKRTECTDLKKFLLTNIHLIKDEVFLEKLYTYNKDSYDFKYQGTILKMPYKYVKQYVKDQKDLEWLKRNKENFTKEQLKELTLVAMGV